MVIPGVILVRIDVGIDPYGEERNVQYPRRPCVKGAVTGGD